ncbi:MAG: hypothetical protein R3D60_06285 [Paracoccaceae bacterium]
MSTERNETQVQYNHIILFSEEKREYVFTECDPTTASDLEALRSVFDTNGDGKLTATAGTSVPRGRDLARSTELLGFSHFRKPAREAPRMSAIGFVQLKATLKAAGLAAGLHLGLVGAASADDLCAEGVIVIREEAERWVVNFPGFHPFQLSTTLDCDPAQNCAYDISVLTSGVFNVQFADVEIANICETSQLDAREFWRREPGRETPDSPGQYEAIRNIILSTSHGYVRIIRADSHFATESLWWNSPPLVAQDGSANESRYASATVGFSYYHIIFSSER